MQQFKDTIQLSQDIYANEDEEDEEEALDDEELEPQQPDQAIKNKNEPSTNTESPLIEYVDAYVVDGEEEFVEQESTEEEAADEIEVNSQEDSIQGQEQIEEEEDRYVEQQEDEQPMVVERSPIHTENQLPNKQIQFNNFTCPRQLTVHIARKKKLLPCPYCPEQLTNKRSLNQHLDKMHGFFCSVCGQEFSTKRDKFNHERTHKKPAVVTPRPFEVKSVNYDPELKEDCSTCGRRFKTKAALNAHLLVSLCRIRRH